jgi:pyruvate/2-oxoglutarate dehydrogenase complex dihydrolipoamide acyltransferase (E2) component
VTVHPVIMPKLGAYTDDVLLTSWMVAEGDHVPAGGVVLELETEKTTAEVEADAGGFLHQLVPPGEAVPIGTTVGMIAETIEEYRRLAEKTDAGNPFLAYISEGVPGVPAEQAATLPSPPRIETAATRNGPLLSPRARALLLRLGLTPEDAKDIAGSGPRGRIVDRDITEWVEARQATTASPTGGLTVAREIPLRGRRRTIATRMLASLHDSAQLTSVVELDVKPLVELRARLNDEGPRVGVTAILVKLVASALGEHPILNSRVTETAVELLAEINVAVAVETEQGLVAPVVRAADRLSIAEISSRMSELVESARGGGLTPEDLDGGTFTVSNGGIHPVDITTAILNPPQCGILWVGRIKDRPVVVSGGEIAVRPTMMACLTFDHRAVDGAPAAAFLGTLERLIGELSEAHR